MAAKNKKKTNANGVHQATDNRSTNDSPLKLFGQAKDEINGIYEKLNDILIRANQFYLNNQLDSEVLKFVNPDRLSQFKYSIETIKNVLSRNQMKVAFFGRTSNGKSTVINAILRDDVLPRGYGHTTGCFLQIQGIQEDSSYIEICSKNGQPPDQQVVRKPIDSVNQIANALNSNENLEYSTLVKIYWPIRRCALLKHDVVLVDSPGVDVEENLDIWIDEHCHDADVFVLVSNAESTLNIAEKNFFHKVKERLSKPNLFILNNRWDSIAGDPNYIEQAKKVKKQHQDRAITFLSKELDIVKTESEAEGRLFFVSARETLETRCPSINSSNSTSREGYDERDSEFAKFEKCFEESLSKSAVKTKFQKHADRGREIIEELSNLLTSTQALVLKVGQRKSAELAQFEEGHRRIENLFYSKEGTLKHQIQEIKRAVLLSTYCDFDTELRRLSRVVDDFDYQFSVNPEHLSHYKQKLYTHVGKTLNENLRSKFLLNMQKHVREFGYRMTEVGSLLSKDRQQSIEQAIRFKTNDDYIQEDLLDIGVYRQFYTQFQEDLEFRFSLGLFSIIRKFRSKFSDARPKQLDNSQDSSQYQTSMSANTDFLSILERFMMNPPQSPATVGSLAVGGVLVRTVGWRVIVVTTVVYGALYAYEYLTWTNSAKERIFKAQYVRYVQRNLKDCLPIISQHIANSLEQKMASTFTKVKEEVDAEKSEVVERINLLRVSLNKLKLCDDFTQAVLGENGVILRELANFATTFLNI